MPRRTYIRSKCDRGHDRNSEVDALPLARDKTYTSLSLGLWKPSVGLLVCLLLPHATKAEVNLISNGSFEIASIPAPTGNVPVGSTAITDWVVTRDQIDYVGSEWVPSDGTRSIDLDGSPGVGGIAQSFVTEQ